MPLLITDQCLDMDQQSMQKMAKQTKNKINCFIRKCLYSAKLDSTLEDNDNLLNVRFKSFSNYRQIIHNQSQVNNSKDCIALKDLEQKKDQDKEVIIE